MLSLLRRNPQFRRLWLAHVVSRSGDAFNTVAIVVLVFQLTGTGRGVAVAVMFEVLPVPSTWALEPRATSGNPM